VGRAEPEPVGRAWPLARGEALAVWLSVVADAAAGLVLAPVGLAPVLVRPGLVPVGLAPVGLAPVGLAPVGLVPVELVPVELAEACERGGAGLAAPVADGGRVLLSAGAVAGLNVATESIAPATRHTAKMLASSGMTVAGPENGLVSRRSRFRRRCARNSRW
jgi:hypothetical protein